MITVKELREELKKFSPDAPVKYWDEDKGFLGIYVAGQDIDEIDYQMSEEKLTRRQALNKVAVELQYDHFEFKGEKKWQKA